MSELAELAHDILVGVLIAGGIGAAFGFTLLILEWITGGLND